MTNPQFSLFANYSEIFRFESPVSHSFLNSLVGSVFILGMSLLISLMIYQVLTLKKDKVYWLFLSGLIMVLGLLFRGDSFLRLLFSLSAFAVIALSGVKRTKHIQLFFKHGWLSAFLAIIAFLMWSLADKKIYGLMDYFLEAQEKNLFVKALVNTGYYVILTVPTTIVLALGVALLLNSRLECSPGCFAAVPIIRSELVFPAVQTPQCPVLFRRIVAQADSGFRDRANTCVRAWGGSKVLPHCAGFACR